MKAASWFKSVGLLIPVVALLAGAANASAADSEKVVVTVGSMVLVDAPFAVQGFRATDSTIMKAELMDGRKMRIMGLKPGATDLQVTGAGGVSAMYSVSVIDNIKSILGALQKDLDAVPEVDLSINLERVVIKGEISNIDHWQLLQKVLPVYRDTVLNLVTFRPAPEVMLALKKSLESSGYKVTTGAETPEPGVIGLKFSGNIIFVNGSVFSQADVQKVTAIMDAQDWISVRKDTKQGADKPKPDEARVTAVINLAVVPTMLELDVVFVGVTDEEAKTIGVNLAKAGLLVIDSTAAAFTGSVGKDRHSGYSGSYAINSGLEGALKFFSGDGPGRFRSSAHMTFKNDSPEWKTYQSGGTLKVRTATANAVGLNDIEYGMIMKVKGGLNGPKTAGMDVELELSYPVPVGTDYDLKKNKINTSVACDIGQTYVMGGMKNLVEQTSKEGVPFLRSIPIVQWFFSEKNTMRQDGQVLILLSAQLTGVPKPSLPVSAETANTETQAQKSNEQRIDERGNR